MKDITPSNFLDSTVGSLFRGWSSKHDEDVPGISTHDICLLPTIARSFNPDTLLNKIITAVTHPVDTLRQLFGISKPAPQEVYSKSFTSVTPQTDLESLDIPGYDNFEDLVENVKISSLNSNDPGKPDPKTMKELGLKPLAPEEMEKRTRNEFRSAINDLSKMSLPKNVENHMKENGFEITHRIKPYKPEEMLAFKTAYNKLSLEDKKAMNLSDEQKRQLGLVKSDNQKLLESLPPNLKKSLNEDGTIIDPHTGMVASVVFDEKDKKMHVVFGGTGAGSKALDEEGKKVAPNIHFEQVMGDLTTVGLGSHVPPSYIKARELVGVLKNMAEKNGYSLEVKGFSKGGGEAAYAGIYHQVKTLSHCGTALSPACQESLGKEKIESAVKNNLIFNTSVQGDFVTDRKWFNNMGLAWEGVTGLMVSRHIGPGMRVENHNLKSFDSMSIHGSSMDIYNDLLKKKGENEPSPGDIDDEPQEFKVENELDDDSVYNEPRTNYVEFYGSDEK